MEQILKRRNEILKWAEQKYKDEEINKKWKLFCENVFFSSISDKTWRADQLREMVNVWWKRGRKRERNEHRISVIKIIFFDGGEWRRVWSA